MKENLDGNVDSKKKKEGKHEEVFEDYEENQDSSMKEDERLDEDAETEQVEPLLETYLDYANDTLATLYNPFFTVLLWIFYNETEVANQYGIPLKDFVYYFLFSVVIIPFQIIIDICCYNIIEWYHHKPFHDYLDYLKFRFATRKARWKGNEVQVNTLLSDNLQSLDQFCFSSQHYFVLTLYVAGIQQVILGIQTLLWTTDYNIFSDIATLPLVILILLMCVVLQRVGLQIGKLLRIWKIDETIEKLEQNYDEDNFEQLFKRILDPNALKRMKKGEADTLAEVKFTVDKWKQVDRVRIREEMNKNDLMTDKLIAQTYRDMFLKYNKVWLQEQMHEIFTPGTLFKHKKEVIGQFRRVMG